MRVLIMIILFSFNVSLNLGSASCMASSDKKVLEK